MWNLSKSWIKKSVASLPLWLNHELGGTEQVQHFFLTLNHFHLHGGRTYLNSIHEELARVELVEVAVRFTLGRGLKNEGTEVLPESVGSFWLLDRAEGDITVIVLNKLFSSLRVKLLVIDDSILDNSEVITFWIFAQDKLLLLLASIRGLMLNVTVFNLDNVLLVFVDSC